MKRVQRLYMSNHFDNKGRNPLILPEAEAPPKILCPHCRHPDFSARIIQGTVNRTCKKCGEQWQGGLPQVPQDPRIPLPPESYIPPVRFGRDSKGSAIEIRRRPDTRPEFKKGAPIPEGDE